MTMMSSSLRMLSMPALMGIFLSFVGTAQAQGELSMVPMRDGVRLATEVYLPSSGTPPYPTLLYRTPYGRATMVAEGNRISGAVPVVVVVQDTRGRYSSEGVDCVFRCEQGALSDGSDTMAWVSAQSWSNGELVSDGSSAGGIIQYMNAPTAATELRAMFVGVATPSFYSHALFPGGVFREALAEGWLEGIGSSFWLQSVADHPLRDAFWDPVETQTHFSQVDVPAVHLGGWYDIFSQGTLDAFVGYQHEGAAGARGAQKLIIGPWTHGGYQDGASQGQLQYPPNSAQPDIWNTWMAHYTGLAPNQAAIDAIATVQYYVMGDVADPGAPGNEWRQADDWPVPAADLRFYLQAGGGLAEVCPIERASSTTYQYDPADPSPTLGGANLQNTELVRPGPYDQRPVEARGDAISFETPALSQAQEVTGRIRAHLFVSADVVDTDVMVRMTDVYPDGRSMLVLDGAARLAARQGDDHHVLLTESQRAQGTAVPVDVDLWSTSIIFAPGHRIRVTITSSNYPRFAASSNDGSNYGQNADPVVAQVSIHHHINAASYLELPNPPRFGEVISDCPGDILIDAGVAGLDGGASLDGGRNGVDGGAAGDGGSSLFDGGSALDSGSVLDSAPVSRDGGGLADASDTSPPSGGSCACRAVPGGGPGSPWLGLSLLALFLLPRRSSKRSLL